MKPGCFERVLHSSIETLQDGGLHGWIAVLGLFTSKLAWNILLKGLGMMLPTLQEQFDTSTWLIGWMVAFVNAGGYFAGKHDRVCFGNTTFSSNYHVYVVNYDWLGFNGDTLKTCLNENVKS